jgi:hypothetical protein
MAHEPTHHIPKELQDKLVEAKEWRDKRQELVDAGYTDASAWSNNVSEGVLLLAEIVDMVDAEWGFAGH